ncbi:MAG: Rrf2 family transcriptional regulator [Lachnospiraceae bacterium]|nr:Rrf2 family transcriptional regulator [Lachnospiraceae bacterium]
MKVSTRGRYALRLMLELALHYDEGINLTLKSVAEKQNISIKYLEQIITPISRAGYVKSVRGAQGGYRLASSPENYTVGMILRLTEGSLAPVACVDEDGENPGCDRIDCCITFDIWAQMRDAINQVVDSITLKDLVDKYYLKQSH